MVICCFASLCICCLLGLAACITQPQQGANPYFAPYLKPDELPDGALMPLFNEIWTVIGSGLSHPNFTKQVDLVATGIFSQYSFHGEAVGTEIGIAAPTYLDGNPVDPQLLVEDDYSRQMLAGYNSLWIHLNVTIDNQAWYPDLGYVARTNHNRLANKLQSEGFNVMAWVATKYVLEQPAIQVLHRMPIQTYKSFLVDLEVTGNNLVPMTIQKQNVVMAVVADVLTPNAVWFINCTRVNQTSAAPGTNRSTAVVSLIVEQDAEALYVGQALTNVINDTLGTPLFDVKTASAGLPLSAAIKSIRPYPGHSITDQVKNRFIAGRDFAAWKIGLSAAGGISGLAIAAIAVLLIWRRRQRQKSAPMERYKSHSLDTLIGVQSSSSSHDALPPQAKLLTVFGQMRHKCGVVLNSALTTLHPSASKPRQRLSTVELGYATDDDTARSVRQLTNSCGLNADIVKICHHANGEKWVLGLGSWGVVYKAKIGGLEVAVKTINRQFLNPKISIQEALRVMQKELKILEKLRYNRNVVQFYGSYIEQGDVMLVFEYMEGGDLRNAIEGLQRAELGWYQLGAKIALDIIKGLNFLHAHHILHRDVKSGNVLLSKDYSSAKICDVGLAHMRGNTSFSSHNTKTTFAYAAPEMLMGIRCDETADIYSFGVVLWEIITQESARRGYMRGVKVPEECPQAIADMLSACLDQANKRPTPQQIQDVIEASEHAKHGLCGY